MKTITQIRDKQARCVNIAYHRNGVSGEGFHVVLFRWDGRDMVATVFEGPGQIAVLDSGLASGGWIGFGVNSWRGDDFEKVVREWIQDWQEK